MSGIACPVDWPTDQIYCSPNGLLLFFRDDILSNKVSFNTINAKEFVESLKELSNIQENDSDEKYVITAQDGETFGWHHKKYERTFLSKIFELINDQNDIKTVFISELEKYIPIAEKRIIPKDSSWSTNYDLSLIHI